MSINRTIFVMDNDTIQKSKKSGTFPIIAESNMARQARMAENHEYVQTFEMKYYNGILQGVRIATTWLEGDEIPEVFHKHYHHERKMSLDYGFDTPPKSGRGKDQGRNA